MKTLEDVLAALDDDGKAAIHSAIEAEKNKGIELHRKANSDKERLIGTKKKFDQIAVTLEELGFDANADDVSDQLKSGFTATKGKVTADQAELKKTQREMKLALEQLAEERKEKEEVKKTNLLEKTIGALKGKVYSHEAEAFFLVQTGKVSYGSDGKTVVWKDDSGEIDSVKGIDGYIKSRPDIAISTQKGGSGSSPGGSEGGKKAMALSDFDKLTPRQQGEHFADGGTVTE